MPHERPSLIYFGLQGRELCTAHWNSWENTGISECVGLTENFKQEILSEWFTSQHSHHSNSGQSQEMK